MPRVLVVTFEPVETGSSSTRTTSARILIGLTLGVAGCASDTISRGREDSGVAPMDGGSNAPLALTAGMTFSYHAIVTRREASNQEETTQYTLTLTIDSVDDRGNTGDSTLQV